MVGGGGSWRPEFAATFDRDVAQLGLNVDDVQALKWALNGILMSPTTRPGIKALPFPHGPGTFDVPCGGFMVRYVVYFDDELKASGRVRFIRLRRPSMAPPNWGTLPN